MRSDRTFSCCIIGETTLAVQCGELLLKNGHRITGVVSPTDRVRTWAQEQGIACCSPEDGFQDFLRQRSFDYLFSIVNHRVLTADVLSRAGRWPVNFHDALLPRYAGIHATSWAILNREQEHGITWHVMSERVDQGDVLKQRRIAVSPRETAMSLNIKCYEAALDAFDELIGELARGEARLRRQDVAGRTYYGLYHRPEQGCLLTWRMAAEDMDAFVRALDFGRYPNPIGAPKLYVDGYFIIVRKTNVLETRSRELPGTVLSADGDGLTIATGTRDIRMGGFVSLEGRALSADALRETCGVHEGFRFTDIEPAAGRAITARYAHTCRHERYWQHVLAQAEPVRVPEPYRTGCEGPSGRFCIKDISLPDNAGALLNGHPQSALFAVFAAFLARMTGRREFDIGFCSGASDETAGFFARHVPVRIAIDGSKDLAELCRKLEKSRAAAEAHDTFPRDITVRYPSLQTVQVDMPTAFEAVSRLSDCEFAAGPELRLQADVEGACRFVYDPASISPGAARQLERHFIAFFENAAHSPAHSLDSLSLVSEEDRHTILYDWNATAADYDRDGLMHALFEKQAAMHPDSPATLFEGTQVSYGGLDRHANRLARYLQQKGVGPERLVGICLSRSHDMIAALLGILKAGGAYVPLDPSHPRARLESIVEKARISIVVTEQEHKTLVDFPDVERVVIDREKQQIEALSGSPPACSATAENTAYVIFTSGSTGAPKGVVVQHRPVINLIEWLQKKFDFCGRDCVLFTTALGFDLSVFDIFGILAGGGKIRIVGDRRRMEPGHLADVLCTEDITFWDSAPAALQLLVPALRQQPLPVANRGLRLVFLSGDWIPVTLPDEIRTIFPGTRVISLGGATEATVWSNYYPVERVDPFWRSIPYGRPIQNARYHILDACLQPCPVGVAGDLYIGGECLSAGYLNEPDLTARSFIPDPFSSTQNDRLYRTGDLARYFPDGNMEFMGRSDFQVKVRGYRIELGEIEHVLRSCGGIRDAVVVVRDEETGGQKLVAYVVPAGDPNPTQKELREHAAQKLPGYMVPNIIAFLPEFPVTSNGKVDRAALPWPVAADSVTKARGTEAAANDATPLKEYIAECFREVLQSAELGPEDDLFDCGVTSLNLIQVAERLHTERGITVAVEAFLDHPTAAAIAAFLGGCEHQTATGRKTATPQPAASASAPPEQTSGSDGDLSGAICSYFREVLQSAELGPEDDLFDCGVTSLNLIQVAERLHTERGITVAVEAFLDHPTAVSIAAFIEKSDVRVSRTAESPGSKKPPAAQSVQHPVRPAADPGGLAGLICGCFREVLQGIDIGPEDDLFDLGVTSLNLIQVAERLQKEQGITVAVEAFLDHPTAAAIAAHIIESKPLQSAPAQQQTQAAPAAPAPIELDRLSFRLDVVRAVCPDFGFSGEAVSFPSISRLLGHLKQETVDGASGYLYPSAGGLHAVQTYLYARPGAVEKLPQGVYYYHPCRHSLFALACDDIPDDILPRAWRGLFNSAAFCLFFIARLSAIDPIYSIMSRALVTLDAGYMTRLLLSRASECSLSVCAAPGIDFERIRSLFNPDDGDEFTVCLLGGRPQPPEREPVPPFLNGAPDLTGHFSGSLPDRSGLVPDRITKLDRLNAMTDEEHDRFHARQLHLRSFEPGTEEMPLDQVSFSRDEYLLRATHREYLTAPLPFRAFSGFLQLLRQDRTDNRTSTLFSLFGGEPLLDVYVAVKPDAVERVPEGLYRYDDRKHSLNRAAAGSSADMRIAHFPGNRSYYVSAGFSLLLIADTGRLHRLYGPEGLQLATLEAGSIGQVLMDRQSEFGLGVCAIGGMRFDKVRSAFGLEDTHMLVHSFLCGPVERSMQRPSASRITV